MIVVERKTAVALAVPLVLCWLQGNGQSGDPEQPTEASPFVKYTIPINSNNLPEMMVSSSVPTAICRCQDFKTVPLSCRDQDTANKFQANNPVAPAFPMLVTTILFPFLCHQRKGL